MRLLVFQHIACEHPGVFRRFLKDDGISWEAVELDRGDPIPLLENYDMLWVMGGPMDVWDVEECAWLVTERRAIRRWVSELGRPFLGVCLGHQLLADALNGTCGSLNPPEVGILDIALTEEGRADPVFDSLPAHMKALQWHGVRVAQAPEGALILASSDACPIQAMRVGSSAYSLQYRVEIEPDTIANWGQVPTYARALEGLRGKGAAAVLAGEAEPLMEGFAANARTFYKNFMKAVA